MWTLRKDKKTDEVDTFENYEAFRAEAIVRFGWNPDLPAPPLPGDAEDTDLVISDTTIDFDFDSGPNNRFMADMYKRTR